MENFRCKSIREGNEQNCGAPTSMKGFRSYSTTHTSSAELSSNANKMKRNKNKVSSPSSSSCGFESKNWSFNEAEVQRKKRVVGYKAYGVEGKMKGSLSKSFTWIKQHLLYPWST